MVAVNKQALLESVWEKVDEEESFSGFDRIPFQLDWLAIVAQKQENFWTDYDATIVTGRLVELIKAALREQRNTNVSASTAGTGSIPVPWYPNSFPASSPPGLPPLPGPLHSHNFNTAVCSSATKRQRTFREDGVSSGVENTGDGNSISGVSQWRGSEAFVAGGSSNSRNSNYQGGGSDGEAASAGASGHNQVGGAFSSDVEEALVGGIREGTANMLSQENSLHIDAAWLHNWIREMQFAIPANLTDDGIQLLINIAVEHVRILVDLQDASHATNSHLESSDDSSDGGEEESKSNGTMKATTSPADMYRGGVLQRIRKAVPQAIQNEVTMKWLKKNFEDDKFMKENDRDAVISDGITYWEQKYRRRQAKAEKERMQSEAARGSDSQGKTGEQVPGSQRVVVAALFAATSMDDSKPAAIAEMEKTHSSSDVEMDGAREDAVPKAYTMPSYDFGSTPHLLTLYGYNGDEVDNVVLRLATRIPTESTAYASYPQTASPEWRNMFSNFKLKAQICTDSLMDVFKDEETEDNSIILSPAVMSSVRDDEYWELDAVYPISSTDEGITAVLHELERGAEAAAVHGKELGFATTVIISHRCATETRMTVPSLLACAAVHQHLVRLNLREWVCVIVEAGDATEVVHAAALLAYGATAVCPFIAYEALAFWNYKLMIHEVLPGLIDTEDLAANYTTSISRGVQRICFEHGLSVSDDNLGKLLFEAKNVTPSIVDSFFPGTVSSGVGSTSLMKLHEATSTLHSQAFASPDPPIDEEEEVSHHEEEENEGGERRLEDVAMNDASGAIKSVVVERSLAVTNGDGDKSNYANVKQQTGAKYQEPARKESSDATTQDVCDRSGSMANKAHVNGVQEVMSAGLQVAAASNAPALSSSGGGKKPEKQMDAMKGQVCATDSVENVGSGEEGAVAAASAIVVAQVEPDEAAIYPDADFDAYVKSMREINPALYAHLLGYSKRGQYAALDLLMGGCFRANISPLSQPGRLVCKRHRGLTDRKKPVGVPDPAYIYTRYSAGFHWEVIDGMDVLLYVGEDGAILAAWYGGITEDPYTRSKAMDPKGPWTWFGYDALEMTPGSVVAGAVVTSRFNSNICELALIAVGEYIFSSYIKNKRQGGREFHIRTSGECSLSRLPRPSDFRLSAAPRSNLKHSRCLFMFAAPSKESLLNPDLKYLATDLETELHKSGGVYREMYTNDSDPDPLEYLDLYPNRTSAAAYNKEMHGSGEVPVDEQIQQCKKAMKKLEGKNVAVLVGESDNLFLPRAPRQLLNNLAETTVWLLSTGSYSTIIQAVHQGVENNTGPEPKYSALLKDLESLNLAAVEALGGTSSTKLTYEELHSKEKDFISNSLPTIRRTAQEFKAELLRISTKLPPSEKESGRYSFLVGKSVEEVEGLSALPHEGGPVDYKPVFDYISKLDSGIRTKVLVGVRQIDPQFGSRIPADKLKLMEFVRACMNAQLAGAKYSGISLDMTSSDFLSLPQAEQEKLRSFSFREKQSRLIENSVLVSCAFCAEWMYTADSTEQSYEIAHAEVLCPKVAGCRKMMAYPLGCYKHESLLSWQEAESFSEGVISGMPLLMFLKTMEPTLGTPSKFPLDFYPALRRFLMSSDSSSALPGAVDALLPLVSGEPNGGTCRSMKSVIKKYNEKQLIVMADGRVKKIEISSKQRRTPLSDGQRSYYDMTITWW